jgi:hypothetical protein
MFRSRYRNIQASQIFQEAENLVPIRSHAIEDDYLAFLALEPIHSIYCYVCWGALECFFMLIK